MHESSPFMNRTLCAFCAALFAAPSIVFACLFWKTVYVTVTMLSASPEANRHDTLVGAAIFFLLVTAVCGLISFKFIEMARTGFELK